MSEERPKDWHLTISDLMELLQSGERKFVDQHEWKWAREYEQSLVPNDVRIPQKGDVYEVMEEITVNYMTTWSAPFTGGGETRLAKGERIWIDTETTEKKPIGIYAQAVEYKRLERQIVPKADREAANYGGFYFFFTTVQLNEQFKLIETGFQQS